ncbi:hypothetical protein A9Q87_10480 [Flavobacteriales bacterium 34_180_T64]|nr:hypothetical protein A9Q87_10480 [Flavobacteriales bacterium 34_180_T64]
MNKLLFLFVIVFICNFNAYSQKNINNYKYIIVPTSFDFLKGKDKFQLNSLTEFLFNKYGYTAIMQDETLPEDLNGNRCLALYANVHKLKGGLLKTKIQIDLLDCNEQLVHSSRIGETREKNYSKAYNLALRDAFVTYQGLSYTYQPIKSSVNSQNNQIDIKQPVSEKDDSKPVVVVAAIPQKKVESEVVMTSSPTTNTNEIIEVLYAQPIDNGFQIIDTTPKKVMILYYSGIPDTFIVKDRDAIVYKKGDLWILSENNGSTLKEEVVNLKF